MIDEPPATRSRRAVLDLIALVSVCVVVVALAALLRPMQSLLAHARQTNGPQADALFALALVLPVATAFYARRRYHEAVTIRGQLVRLSLHDALTGLPNRRLLGDWLSTEIERSQRMNAQAAVLFVDLDRFKYVNDTHGHEVGDRLMAAVAARLVELIGSSGRILRYGGDEFVVIMTETGSQAATRLAEQIIATVERPFTVGRESLRISASVGVALAEHKGVNPEDVVRDADVAMFQAKAGGPGRVVVFDRAMEGALTPANAEQLIRAALDNGEFHLYYQAVVSLETGRIVGAEALLRWVTEGRGPMSPAEFIPIMEETGLIVPVGTWVLEEACRQAARLSTLSGGEALTITVNVSARQIAQLNFADTVSLALRTAGVSPDRIHLEITEGALMHDVGSAWAVLRQVKAHGVRLALDDFGTGYSSLSYVRRFSLDMLKIDKSFIDGLDTSVEDRAIVEHVVGMAHALGMSTVAEGVERPEQLAWLRRLGCRFAQGYAMSRPIPAGEFERLLVERHRDPFPLVDIDPDEARPTVPTGPPTSLVQARSRNRRVNPLGPAAATTTARGADLPPPIRFAPVVPLAAVVDLTAEDPEPSDPFNRPAVDDDLDDRAVPGRSAGLLPRFREYRAPAEDR